MWLPSGELLALCFVQGWLCAILLELRAIRREARWRKV